MKYIFNELVNAVIERTIIVEAENKDKVLEIVNESATRDYNPKTDDIVEYHSKGFFINEVN